MHKQGFTLIELMVTVTIMMIMTATVFFNYNQFNDSSALSSIAYDLSLTIRQAQVYGVAVRGSGAGDSINNGNYTSIPASADYSNGYGVHFDQNKPGELSLFLDAPDSTTRVGNGVYDGNTSSDVLLQTYKFSRGITISGLCVLDSTGICITNDPSVSSPSSLDITFRRPDPEATISINGMVNGANVSFGAAKITLQNAGKSISKSVAVYSTGQIAVQ